MDKKNHIGLIIKDLRLKKKLSQGDFAASIGMVQSYLSAIEKGEKGITVDNIIKISKVYGVSYEYLLEGRDTSVLGNIPLLSTQAAAGYFLGVGDVVVEDYLSLPGIKGENHIAINVRGSSMHPTITEGDVLVCRKIISMEEFVSGRVYVCLLASDTTTVKRVYIKNGIARLVSDNSVVEPLEIPQNELSQLWSVRYRITDHLRPENIEELYPVQ